MKVGIKPALIVLRHITIPGGPVTITESAETLFTAIAPRKQLFYRGGVVVELVNEGEGYTVQVLDAVAAQSRFEKYVRFFKNTKVGDHVYARTDHHQRDHGQAVPEV